MKYLRDTKYFEVDQIKVDEMGEPYSTQRGEKFIQSFGRKN
jgi:hypothetical protein